MKISEMTNDQAAEALIRLSVPFGNICDDERMIQIIDRYTHMQDMPFIQMVGRILPEAVGYALKEHRADLYEIVGALTMKKQDEVAKMNFMDTINTLKESYDEVLKGFFTSSARQIRNSVSELSQT